MIIWLWLPYKDNHRIRACTRIASRVHGCAPAALGRKVREGGKRKENAEV